MINDDYEKLRAEHDCGDPLCKGLPEFPVTIEQIANRIDARAAQIAVARILAMLGSVEDWGSDQLGYLPDIVMPAFASAGDLPTFADQDDAALAFWESVR